MKDRLLIVAVVIPILGLLALIGRAEINLKAGRPWMIRISGYDPRDLISGHYLRYRYAFEWRGGTCGELSYERGDLALDPACCLCFEPQDGSDEPAIRQVSCDVASACMSWVRSADVGPPQRYFIPEERAREIEDAVRSREAALRVTVTDDGTLAVDRLYIDGEPWAPAAAAD